MQHKKLLALLLVSNICFSSDHIIEYNVPKPIVKSISRENYSCAATAYPYSEKVNQNFTIQGKVAYDIGYFSTNEMYFIDTYICIGNICSHDTSSVSVYPYMTFSKSWPIYFMNIVLTATGKYDEDVIIQISKDGTIYCSQESKSYITVT